jgi:PAS domain S-box-containing protein
MDKPLIKEKNGIILDINDEFLHLTQFTKNELCGKHIDAVLDELFRCNHKINISNEEIQTVLFTKTFDVRFVKIKKYEHFKKNIADTDLSYNLYFFNEIENSRLDNKLLFIENLINDNKIGIGIYTASDIKLIKSNQRYLDYLPRPFNTKEVGYGACMSEFVPKFDESKAKKVFTDVVKLNKTLYVTEKQGIMLGDNDYWDNTITPISENGEVKYILSILDKVTERVLSRKHIQIKNKQLESIIESVDDIISIVNKNGKFTKLDNIMSKLFGKNENFYIGHSTIQGKYYDLAGNPIPSNELCFMKLLEGEKIKDQKVKYVYNNKEYYLCLNAIPIFNENEQFEMGVIVTHDITELVQNNKLISNQKKELEIIVDNAYDALAVIDKNGNLIRKNYSFANQGNRSILIPNFDRIGETMLKGQKYYNDNDEELNLKELPGYRVLNGETVKQERLVIKNNNHRMYLEFNGVPIFDEMGNFQYGILLAHDITHIMRKNNKIKQQQRLVIKAEQEKLEAVEKALAMKDEFISLISHEFKTPLNVIYSAIQLIDYVYADQMPDKLQGLLKNIKQNTFRQLRLVNNLLDITRLNSGRLKLNISNIDIVSLTKQISESVKLYSNEKNIKLLFTCSLNCKNVAIDDEKLERIILNLLSNAIKFTAEGGTVTVNLDENKETNMIVIEVSDTGMGIPKDKQELIFERFGQVDSNLSRHAEGTGIGLSLVKKLVDVLNGKIELESELVNGSTFRITLPTNDHIEKEKNGELFDKDNRLVHSLHVEFSDIYL